MAKKRASQQELAAALHVSDRTVRTLEANGVLPGAGPGGYDLEACMRAYIAHRAHDVEAKQARLEAVSLATADRRMQMRHRAKTLATSDELEDLATELWAGVWQTWGLVASHAYHGMAVLVDERELRGVWGLADDTAKAELHLLREKFELRLKGARVELADEDRITQIMASLAGAEG